MPDLKQETRPHPEPERDAYGRYKLKTPSGGTKAHQRVTTFAGLVADTYNISKWMQRSVAIGLHKRPDLYSLMGSYRDPHGDNRDQVNILVDQAREASGASTGATLGTALHSYTEQFDLGIDVQIPTPWDQDVKAYDAALLQNNIKIIPEYVERVVALDQYTVAGTFDRIVEIDGQLYIADLKTGKDPAAFPHEICIQLGCYANADVMYDYNWEREPMPDVDKERALVMHLPPGKATCEFYWFDIASGWAMAETCYNVRQWRKKKAGLVTNFDGSKWVSTYKGKGAKSSNSSPATPITTTAQTAAPAATTPPSGDVCVDCGNPITPGFLELSMFKFGLPLCSADYSKHQ